MSLDREEEKKAILWKNIIKRIKETLYTTNFKIFRTLDHLYLIFKPLSNNQPKHSVNSKKGLNLNPTSP